MSSFQHLYWHLRKLHLHKKHVEALPKTFPKEPPHYQHLGRHFSHYTSIVEVSNTFMPMKICENNLLSNLVTKVSRQTSLLLTLIMEKFWQHTNTLNLSIISVGIFKTLMLVKILRNFDRVKIDIPILLAFWMLEFSELHKCFKSWL